MTIEVQAHGEEGFLSAFAKTVGSKVINGRVTIPGKYGNGYVMGYLFGHELRMIVRHYELMEDVLIKRQPDNLPASMILISFKNILKDVKRPTGGPVQIKQLPSVTISTQGLDPEVHIPGKINFNAINLSVDASYLKKILGSNIKNNVLKNIIENNQPLVFEQLISTKLQQVSAEIIDTDVPPPLQHFFYKLKTEELICYMLMELTERQTSNLQAVNIEDFRKLYMVRDKLISDLAKAPALSELASYATMSVSKLKRLFSQVFGCTIYNYYQNMRMKEAAHLLKVEKLSVSEVGYKLGFVNLSHFSRVFEEHIGMKPKKFSASFHMLES